MTDDFEDFINSDEMELDYTSNYEDIDTKSATVSINNQCKQFIGAMSDLYMGVDLSERENFGVSKAQKMAMEMARLEVIPLSNLLYQVKIGKHVLQTLIIQLNSGGFRDAELFNRIDKAQNTFAKLNETLIKYLHSIPQVFMGISAEMRMLDEQTAIEYEEANVVPDGVVSLPSGEDSDDEYSLMTRPIRGTGALIKAIRETKAELEEDIAKANEVDVSREGNLINNPLRGGDGKLNIDELA